LDRSWKKNGGHVGFKNKKEIKKKLDISKKRYIFLKKKEKSHTNIQKKWYEMSDDKK